MPDVDVLALFSIQEDVTQDEQMLRCDVTACHWRESVERNTVRQIFNKAMKHYEEAHRRG